MAAALDFKYQARGETLLAVDELIELVVQVRLRGARAPQAQAVLCCIPAWACAPHGCAVNYQQKKRRNVAMHAGAPMGALLPLWPSPAVAAIPLRVSVRSRGAHLCTQPGSASLCPAGERISPGL